MSKINLKILIERYLTETKTRKAELLRRIGYKNISKGLRRLGAFIATGNSHPSFLKRLATELAMDSHNLRKSIRVTELEAAQKEREELKRCFKPHIRIKHKLERPANITAVALLGASCFKEIELSSSLSDKPFWKQLESIREIILEHYGEKDGFCLLFGQITGYHFYYRFDEWVALSSAAEIKGYYKGENLKPEAVLHISGKKISGGVL